MKLRRRLLVAAAVFAVAFGTISGALPWTAADGGESCFSAGACGRCGDGQCVKSCGETALSCPRDCGVPSDSAR
ncbi:MAG TPA: hypothetical protein VF588_05770 [Pyrinomonadaceae bacterium]|jgi:hypothetical protein